MSCSRIWTSAACLLACGLLSDIACAQSSVTLFGTVDAAVRQSRSDAGSITSLVSGAYSSARWGLRGQEELGGGQRVGVWLESFLSADTGTATPAGFQRRSTVSFTDDRWGEIRLGRDYTPTHQNWARFDPFGYVGIGSVQLLILSATGTTPVTAAFRTNPNDIQRVNNAVQYLLPRNDWGVEGGLVVAAGEGGDAANDLHRASGGRLGVTIGQAFVQAATLVTRDNSTGTDFRDADLAGSYNLPWARLSAGVRRLTYKDAAQNNFLAGLSVPLGLHEVKFSWNRAQMRGVVGTTRIDQDRTDQFALGYAYHLSKKTHVYGTLASMRNTGNARFVMPGAPAVARGGSNSRGLEIGLNQEF